MKSECAYCGANIGTTYRHKYIMPKIGTNHGAIAIDTIARITMREIEYNAGMSTAIFFHKHNGGYFYIDIPQNKVSFSEMRKEFDRINKILIAGDTQ